jgi:hypothetical protein
MATDLSDAPGTGAKFWDGFLEVVRAQGVKAPYDRWYVIHLGRAGSTGGIGRTRLGPSIGITPPSRVTRLCPGRAVAKDRQEADPGLGSVCGTHGDVLHALIAETYSIRTEQAYEHWACRFSPFAATGSRAIWAPPRLGRFSKT